MRPLTLTLPDSLRDTLERELDGDHAEGAVERLLFPAHPAPALRPFLDQLQQAILTLQDGSGNPVIYLRNLPHNYGLVFSEQLFDLFRGKNAMYDPQNGWRGPGPYRHGISDSVRSGNEKGFHRDGAYLRGHDGEKRMLGFYCDNPGIAPVPTIFVSLDELMRAVACRRLGLAADADDRAVAESSKQAAYAQQFGEVLQEFRTAYGVTDNPNAHGEAPCYLMPVPFYDFKALSGSRPLRDTHTPLQQDIAAVAPALRQMAAAQSAVNTEPNTLCMVNDALVYHDRARTVENDRRVQALDYYPTHAAADTPLNYAIAQPASTVDLTEHPAWLEKAPVAAAASVSAAARG